MESRAQSLDRVRLPGAMDLMLLLMVLIWGVNYSIIKIALSSFAPFAFNVLRFGLATLLMLALLKARGESLHVARSDIPAMILLGMMGHGIYQLLFISGVALTTPANSSFILATMPIFAAIFAHFQGIERANRTVWAGVLMSFLGILLLVLGGNGPGLELQGSTIIGDLCCLGAALLWAASMITGRRLLLHYSPVKVTTLQMLVGTPLLIAVGLPSMVEQRWSQVPLAAWGGIFYSAVLATVVGYILWSVGLQRVGNARTAIYSNVTPIISAVSAWLLLGDGLRSPQIIGAGVVIAGLLLARRGRVSAASALRAARSEGEPATQA
jgi:drug/metabolite transporter (DMT)-like permease